MNNNAEKSKHTEITHTIRKLNNMKTDKNINDKSLTQVNDIRKLVKLSDIISIHTPLNEETLDLFTINEFRIMKKNSYIINTARGGIINEVDLKIALNDKLILGAAIDVYNIEPPNDLELLEIENLICTPHIGGNAYEAVFAMGESAINHLINFKNQIYK
jgi:phosphoglycerate dehydrogenase-like enzyme